jgi:hypothetical protein
MIGSLKVRNRWKTAAAQPTRRRKCKGHRSQMAKNTLTPDVNSAREYSVGLWIQLFIAIALPAILVASLPQRWLRWAMLLWVLSPVVVYCGVVAWEIATRPVPEHALGNAVFGLMLIGSITAVPWLIGCAIGFGVGFALRRLFGRAPLKSNAPRPAPTAITATSGANAAQSAAAAIAQRASGDRSADRGFAGELVVSGWRAVHIGFENDGLRLGDLEVWRWPWRSAGLAPLRLPHPAHPHQVHDFDIYEIGDARHPLRFATGELSNGVWGFYVPASVEDVQQRAHRDAEPRYRHTAPDGTLRVDVESVEWFNTHWVNTPRVIDLDSGRVLLDLWNTDWDAVVSFPAPRCARLGMRRYRSGISLTLDLDLGRDEYRISFAAGSPTSLPSGPLADVARALEACSAQLGAQAASAHGTHGSTRVPVHPWAAWRSALSILAAALIAIATATWWSLNSAPPGKQKLDTVPTMPGAG